MVNMKFKVTAKDIQSGHKNNCVSCPIALVLRKALPEYNIQVMDDYIWVEFNRPGQFSFNNISLPHTAVKFIEEFDKTGSGEPFEFSLSAEGFFDANR